MNYKFLVFSAMTLANILTQASTTRVRKTMFSRFAKAYQVAFLLILLLTDLYSNTNGALHTRNYK